MEASGGMDLSTENGITFLGWMEPPILDKETEKEICVVHSCAICHWQSWDSHLGCVRVQVGQERL